MEIKKIIEISELQKSSIRQIEKKRFLYNKIANSKGKHLVGLVGPRGVGKTIMLKQLSLEKADSVYFSVDSILEYDLFELVKTLHLDYKFKNFFIDEIHYDKNYANTLKAIYDLLPIERVYFSSSVGILLNSLPADLSRRVILYPLYPFDFREYLYFKYNRLIHSIEWKQLIQNEISPEILQSKAYFDAFLKGQLMPFALEEPEPIPLLKNILEIILEKDISRVGDITSTDKDQIRNLIRFMAKSEGVDGISYTSISKNIGATKYKVMQYVNLLEKAFILIQVQPYGSSVTKEPKILLAPPYRLLEKSFENAIGGLREDYFVFTMQGFLRSNFDNLKYLKSIRGAKTPDFLVKTEEESIVIEVGGRSKSHKQFKDFKKADRRIVVTHDEKEEGSDSTSPSIPLHAFGFLEVM